MRKKNKYLLLMATFVIALLAIGSQTLKLKAETVKDKQIRNVQFPEAEDLWLNKAKLQSGRLIYGLTKGREIKGSSLFPDGSTNFVPNVNYEDGDGTIVRHIFDARRFSIDGVPNATARQDYETRTTVPFNLILSESEYNANFLSLSGGYVSFLNAVETANPEGITATGYRADPSEGVAETASELELSLKMQSNTNDSAVEHYYTIINNSKTKTTKVYPIKQVDTQFANDDYVEVYSRGENKGAYIVNRGINEGTNGKQYRLDYIMDFKNDNPENVHRPLFYAGTHYTDKNAYVFGPNMASQGDGVPVQRSMQAKEGEPLYNQEIQNASGQIKNADSGILMSWGEVTLAPGETYTMRYDVGIKPMATLEMTKKAENKTSNDGKTRVGDKIEYTVTLAAPKGSYSNVKFEDVLPKGFEQPKPDDIVTVNPADGSAAESILMKDAYVTDVPVGKEGIGTVKLPVAGNGYTIPKDKTVTIKFTLTVAKEAAGEEIKNVATVSGKTEEDTTFTDDVEDENPFTVENSQPVIVKHVDEKGVPLPGIPDKPYEGDIGATITIDPENDHKLNGYMYVKASKSLTVTFSELEQEILLYYKENRFTIKQEVSKTNGSDAHNAAVDMGELLKYTTTVTSQLKPDTTPGADIVYYDNFAVVANVSEHLKDVSKFKLVSTKGVELPSIDYKYDPIANTISVTLLRAHGITSDEHLVLTYEGTVKDISDVDIKAKATASGNYSDGMVATAITSNEVISKRGAGNLEFTAPTNWDFGERAISDKEQEYSLAKLDEHILVTDNRAVGSKWKLDATLTSNFTLAGSGIEMPNVLKYKKGTNLSSLELNTPKEIVSAETTAGTRGKAVNVTENWVANKEGLVLVVPGSIVKKGTYEAAITWTVTDAP